MYFEGERRTHLPDRFS